MRLCFLFLSPFLVLTGAGEVTISPPRIEKIEPNRAPASPAFKVVPGDQRFRFRLDGLESKWTETSDDMNFFVRFIREDRILVDRIAFPITGSSPGWNGDLDLAVFVPRNETVSIPPGIKQIQIGISSSGSPNALGVYAIKHLNVTSIKDQKITPLLIQGKNPSLTEQSWHPSGTQPSMAQRGPGFPAQLHIIDTDLTAHADWVTVPIPISGDQIKIDWLEAYSIGAGGNVDLRYSRLPPGKYQLKVEELDIMGNPQAKTAPIDLIVPRPLWQTWWFWLLSLSAITLIIFFFGRSVVRRRVQRAIRHTRLIENERLRIAMDLHDDIGTRLSRISLAASHAGMKSSDQNSTKSFQEITELTGDLAGSLSETVWMLSPKNNDLESLIVFLSRIASELCRAGDFRCRIHAPPLNDDIAIAQEFRHHFVISVKEAFNNALKHSQGSEIQLEMKIENENLCVSLSDNGIGFEESKTTTGNGLGNLKARMRDLKGSCSFHNSESGGSKIVMKAPLKQAEY